MFKRQATLRSFIPSVLFLATLLTAWVRPASASSTTVAPVLVPYTVTAIAGNTQKTVPGYGGDGVPGLSATLNGPNALAVDSVGNVYIADQSNALIREWNVQTGVLKNIAGVPPTSCTGITCTTTNPGCDDGVPAVGHRVGSRVQGMVVDGYGNLYFSDYNYQGVWTIYHGGTQPAAFIKLVDPDGVTAAGGVIPGYMYHIAGHSVPKAGGGCTGTTGTQDQVLATSGGFHDPLQMGIDAAGNLYVQDFANDVVRVINTQATTQTIFGVSVQPGFIAAVVGCNNAKPTSLTTTCPSNIPAFGGPVGGALFSSALVGMTADQFGNVYELSTKGANGGIYAGAAYAGGNALGHLINLESGLTATSGRWYEVINSTTSTNGPITAVQAVPANGSNDIVIRPVSIAVDPLGNLYMFDSHWLSAYRVDVNSGMATRINGLNGGTIAGTSTAPTYCAGTSGPQATDAFGDGCNVALAKFSSGGSAYVTFDGAGNLYVADTGNNIVRKVSVNTQFPETTLGSSFVQTLQVHFDASNLPVTAGTAPNLTTAAFTMASGSSDYAVTGATCANYTLGLDGSLECYVQVTFTPTTAGLRGASLQATTASGQTYSFALSGFGNGPKLAVDGGDPATLGVTGLGHAAAVAIDPAGNVYVADPDNNRIAVTSAKGTQSTVGTGLSAPKGVAVDPAGDVYISDSGNNRVLEVDASTGLQTVLTTDVSNPHGIAVDAIGNLYVADTGNARVVEVPAFGELSASPLLAYTGAQTLVTPVGVAVDHTGNVFVADSGNSSGLIEILAGGGDLQTAPGSTSLTPAASIVSFGGAFVTAPSGVAVDAAGNLYVSDGNSNNVQELPAGGGPGSEAVTLNFPGLSSPSGLALDAAANLYVADSGNSRVLIDNRSQVAVNFGTVAQFQPAATVLLTATNVGTSALTPTAPFAIISGATADYAETDTCAASNFPSGTLFAGLHCSITPSFTPQGNGPLAATVAVQGGAVQLNLSGSGENPLVTIAMTLTSPASGAVYGSPAVITLMATQPNGGGTPTGSITFSYTVNGVAQPPTTVNLTPGSGGVATATLTINNLLLARTYVVSASYGGDSNNSPTQASPFTFTVPGLPLTVVANSASSTYGSAVPTLTGTVTGILPADQAAITVTFTSAATSSTPVGKYPIKVTLTGGNSANYTIPSAVTSTGAPAVVTENPAPLTVTVPNFATVFGQPDVTYDPTQIAVGLVNGDEPLYTFTPAHSSSEAVGTYTIVPTLSIPTATGYDKINNYTVKIVTGTLVVSRAPAGITIASPSPAVLPTALSKATIAITVAQPQAGFIGTPTGTVTLQDVFTPLNATGLGTSVTEPKITLNLVAGATSYTPTDPTLGIHVYTFYYSGDSNFLASDTSATPTSLTIDVADFTITSTTTPIQIAPGIVPGGIATATNELAALPETANVTITPVLGSTQVVTLSCVGPASYITCTLTPASVTLNGKTAQVSVVAVSVPATLPINFTAQLRQSHRDVALAFLPLSLLTLLPLCGRRRRIQVSRLLLLVLGVAMLVNVTGCGGNLVKFFTPVPAGPTQVTVTATSGSVSRSFVIGVSIQ